MKRNNNLSFQHEGKEFSLEFSSGNDHIARIICTTRTFYEVEILDYLRDMKIQGEHAIDVGANIGNHSIYFSNYIATNVIAIEANPDLIPILKENLRRNADFYTIIENGIGEHHGFAKMIVPEKENIGTGKLQKGTGDILVTTLDEVSPTSGVFLVKIDVEGMEIDVLRGARNILEKQHPDLIIEAATKANFDEINDFLSEYNYTTLSKWNATPTYHFSYKPNLLKTYHARILEIKSRLHRNLRRKFARIFSS